MIEKGLKNKEKGMAMRNTYRQWKMEALDEAGYFIIFQGFLESGILQRITGNALKLYIYLGMNANNLEGIVWHSNERIGEYFGKSERTIRSWMKELEDLNLIKRMRLAYDERVYTYLQTYAYKAQGDNCIECIIEGELNVDEIGSVYVKGNNMYIPITVSTHLEVWSEEYGDWIYGKLEIRRFEYSEDDTKVFYIFRNVDRTTFFRIDKDTKLKVRILLI